MQNLAEIILDKTLTGHKLVDIICELVESSTEIDYDDVADAIKDNPTMVALLQQEFQKRNMMDRDAEDINLTEVFKGL